MEAATATAAPGGSHADLLCLWPQEDSFRLVRLLEASSVASLAAASRPLAAQFKAAASGCARGAEGAAARRSALEAELALKDLEMVLADAEALRAPPGGAAVQPVAWQSAWENLQFLEDSLHTEMRYVYGPDWEMKAGKLITKKGTWLKNSTRFSWELTGTQKLYLPQGVSMPVMQIGKVHDKAELRRHEWVVQHLRVWMKPPIIRTLEARCNVWFVYWPHWQDKGMAIVPNVDTWMKRSTQMSGELQPFELVYVPRGLALRLACAPAVVDEEWEKLRHQHVHLHRRVTLAAPPLTMKQDQFDIYVGQGDNQR